MSTGFFYSVSFVSILIFITFFLLLDLGLDCSFFTVLRWISFFGISLFSINYVQVNLSSGRLRRCTECSQEELPHIRGQGQQPRVPGCDGTGTAKRSYPTSEARGGGREEQLHIQGAVAARAQESLEELFHVQGKEGRGEEIPLVQGERNPSKMVGEARGHQRAETLKP